MAELAQRIKSRRRAANLSQDGLAAKAGVDQGTISDIESGKTQEPQYDTIEKLSSVLGNLMGDPPLLEDENEILKERLIAVELQLGRARNEIYRLEDQLKRSRDGPSAQSK